MRRQKKIILTFLSLLFGSYCIFAQSSFQNKKDFYSWIKQLKDTKYSYTSTLDQKEYLTTEIAYLTNKVEKGKYKVYNIPFKVLIVDSTDLLQNRKYEDQMTNLFAAKTIYQDNFLQFAVGNKAGIYHLYTLFLHPTKHYTQHIIKQTYRVINEFYFYSGFLLPYVLLLLFLGLSFLAPLKSLRKSPTFFIFAFLSKRFQFLSLWPLMIGFGLFYHH